MGHYSRGVLVYYIVLLLVIALLWSWFKYRSYRKIRLWRKSLNLTPHTIAFDLLYKPVNGFDISRKARHEQDSLDYIYGEIDFASFIALLSLVQPSSQTVFYDLGSGIGKAVLACAMVYPVKKSVGVELLPLLHTCACDRLEQLKKFTEYQETASRVNFILGDFLSTDMEDATIIFINSTTLFGITWERLCMVLNSLPKTAIIITTSKPLISKVFLPKITTQMEMSWGVVSVFIHLRKQITTNPIENIE